MLWCVVISIPFDCTLFLFVWYKLRERTHSLMPQLKWRCQQLRPPCHRNNMSRRHRWKRSWDNHPLCNVLFWKVAVNVYFVLQELKFMVNQVAFLSQASSMCTFLISLLQNLCFYSICQITFVTFFRFEWLFGCPGSGEPDHVVLLVPRLVLESYIHQLVLGLHRFNGVW